jgi:hypothetical protein
MDIKCFNIFQSRAINNYPNWDFWLENKPSGNPALSPEEKRLFQVISDVRIESIEM